MRIRTFTAASTQAAMTLVRNEMGEAAVIIAVDQATNGRGVIVRAAIDDASGAAEPTPPERPIEDRLEALLRSRLARPRQRVRAA